MNLQRYFVLERKYRCLSAATDSSGDRLALRATLWKRLLTGKTQYCSYNKPGVNSYCCCHMVNIGKWQQPTVLKMRFSKNTSQICSDSPTNETEITSSKIWNCSRKSTFCSCVLAAACHSVHHRRVNTSLSVFNLQWVRTYKLLRTSLFQILWYHTWILQSNTQITLGMLVCRLCCVKCIINHWYC
jgi:hypothetical protein